LKVSRAGRHIGELETEITAYVELRPFALEVVQEPQFEWCDLTVRHLPPKHLPTIIGDAIHNLRSALDLLACDLVRLNGRSASETYFPFGASETGFGKQLEDKFGKAADDVKTMLKALRPWEGALREIHTLTSPTSTR
jgi:hypothetical protein